MATEYYFSTLWARLIFFVKNINQNKSRKDCNNENLIKFGMSLSMVNLIDA